MQEEWLPDRDDTDSTPGHKRHSDTARRPYVRVIRPLRDVGRKECALWAWWRGLSVVGKERWPWSGAKQDIGSLTRGVFYCLAWCTQSHVQDKSSSTVSKRTTPPPSQRSSAHAQKSSPKANRRGYAHYARGMSPFELATHPLTVRVVARYKQVSKSGNREYRSALATTRIFCRLRPPLPWHHISAMGAIRHSPVEAADPRLRSDYRLLIVRRCRCRCGWARACLGRGWASSR